MVERLAVNEGVVGSNPTRGAKNKTAHYRAVLFLTPESKPSQTFEIILPNLIHKAKTKLEIVACFAHHPTSRFATLRRHKIRKIFKNHLRRCAQKILN